MSDQTKGFIASLIIAPIAAALALAIWAIAGAPRPDPEHAVDAAGLFAIMALAGAAFAVPLTDAARALTNRSSTPTPTPTPTLTRRRSVLLNVRGKGGEAPDQSGPDHMSAHSLADVDMAEATDVMDALMALAVDDVQRLVADPAVINFSLDRDEAAEAHLIASLFDETASMKLDQFERLAGRRVGIFVNAVNARFAPDHE